MHVLPVDSSSSMVNVVMCPNGNWLTMSTDALSMYPCGFRDIFVASMRSSNSDTGILPVHSLSSGFLGSCLSYVLPRTEIPCFPESCIFEIILSLLFSGIGVVLCQDTFFSHFSHIFRHFLTFDDIRWHSPTFSVTFDHILSLTFDHIFDDIWWHFTTFLYHFLNIQ